MPLTPSHFSKVLVTGATGFMGGAVVRHLHALGVPVLAMGRKAAAGEKLVADGIPFLQADYTLAADLPKLQAMADALGDRAAIVHCAALSSPWGRKSDFVAANEQGTATLLSLAKQAKVQRFVHISSPAVRFAYAEQKNIREAPDGPLAKPANHYVATKRAAEAAVHREMHAIPCVILRPKAMFGPGDTSLLPRVMKLASRGVFPRLGPDTELDLTWIGDACEAVVQALVCEKTGGTYFISSGQPMSRDLIFQTLFEASGMQVKCPLWPRWLALALGQALEWASQLLTGGRWEPPTTKYSLGTITYGQTLDLTAARTDLGYAPTTDVLARLRECGKAWNSPPALASPASMHPLAWKVFSDGYTEAPEAIALPSGSWFRKLRFHAAAFLLEHPSHGPILVDTGYSRRFLEETRRGAGRIHGLMTPVTLTQPGGIAQCLRSAGVDPASVKHVIITHFHSDHLGGLRDFPEAKIYCSPSAWQFTQKLLAAGSWRSVQHGLLPNLLPPNLAQRVIFVGENVPENPFEDCLRFHSLPGHAVGQLGVEFQSLDGPPVLLAADACWLSQSFRENVMPHGLTRVLHDMPSYRRTLQWLHTWHRERPDLLIVPTHCPETANRIFQP